MDFNRVSDPSILIVCDYCWGPNRGHRDKGSNLYVWPYDVLWKRRGTRVKNIQSSILTPPSEAQIQSEFPVTNRWVLKTNVFINLGFWNGFWKKVRWCIYHSKFDCWAAVTDCECVANCHQLLHVQYESPFNAPREAVLWHIEQSSWTYWTRPTLGKYGGFSVGRENVPR